MHVQDVLTGFYAAFFLAFSGTNPHPPPPRNLLFWQRRNRLQVLPGHEDRGTHLQLKGLAKRENNWGDLLDHQASKTGGSPSEVKCLYYITYSSYTYMHMYIHRFVCVCLYLYVCIYTCIYTYIYIYIYRENVFGRPNAFAD